MSIPFVKQFDDFAEAMANPNPDRPIQEAVASFGRSVCDRISARPDIFAPTILQSPLVAACTPYWDSQGYSAPEENLPFTGGQCTGEPYRVRGAWGWAGGKFCSDGSNVGDGQSRQFESTFGNAQYIGPISNVSVAAADPQCQGNGTTIVFTFTHANGTLTQTLIGGSGGSRSFEGVFGQPNFESVNGLDCGNPDPTFEPGPSPAPDPGPLPPGTGPKVNVRGGVVVVLPPTLEINPGLSVELPIGEINLGSGTGGGPAEEPLPGEEIEGEGSGTGGGENDFGEPPEGERWVGCCIRITSAPVGAGVIPSSIPHDVYPIVVGNARLKFQGQSGPLTYDTPIQKRQETSCLWEPVRGMAPMGAFVNLLPGYSYTIRPYSVPLEQ